MVVAESLSYTQTEYTKVLLGDANSLIDRPIICMDGYLISCQYDGETCIPTYSVKIEDLLNSFKEELENFKENKINAICCSPPSKPDHSSVFKLPSRRHSGLAPRSKSLSSKPSHNQPQNGEHIRRKLFSDSEEFLGISSQAEHVPNSFILPTSDGKKSTSADNITNESNLYYSTEKICPSRQLELNNQVEWCEQYGSDYINTETVKDCSELNAMLRILMRSTNATLVTLKINSQTEITVTYQFMKNFKQEYMVVKINQSYCMLMKAF